MGHFYQTYFFLKFHYFQELNLLIMLKQKGIQKVHKDHNQVFLIILQFLEMYQVVEVHWCFFSDGQLPISKDW